MGMITDGAGGCNRARVDKGNRVHTFGITLDSDQHATEKSDSYNINTGLITLTSADESACLWIKNQETRDLKITNIIVILGPSTNGSSTDTTHVRVYKNVTTGSIIDSTPTDVAVNSNRNFGSSKTLNVLAYVGAEAETFTDGSTHIESLISPGNRVPFAIDEDLPTGKSIGVSIEPNDSNSSMKCMIAVVCHLKDDKRESV